MANALQQELDWAANRPSSLIKSQNSGTTATSVEPSVTEDDAYESCLTASELKFLTGYESSVPGGICSLNQNPEVTCVGVSANAQAGHGT